MMETAPAVHQREEKEQLTHLPTCCAELNCIIGYHSTMASAVVHQNCSRSQERGPGVRFLYKKKKKKGKKKIFSMR